MDVRVIEIHAIMPLDASVVVDAANETGAIVVAEEATVIDGLGGAVTEVLSRPPTRSWPSSRPRSARITTRDSSYGTSGPPRPLVAERLRDRAD